MKYLEANRGKRFQFKETFEFSGLYIERNMEGIERLKEDRAFQMQDLGSHRVLHRTAQASLNGGAN